MRRLLWLIPAAMIVASAAAPAFVPQGVLAAIGYATMTILGIAATCALVALVFARGMAS